MYLVVIVPPEEVNGDPGPIPDLAEAIEKVMAEHGATVWVEVA